MAVNKYIERYHILEQGLYLLIFLLPWQTRWIVNESVDIEYWRISIYAVDVLIVILAVIAGITLIRRRYISISARSGAACSNRVRLLYFLIALLFMWSFVGIFWAPDKTITIYKAWKLIEAGLMVWLFTKINFSFYRVLVAFIASAVIQAMLGIQQFISQNVWGSKWLGIAAQKASDLGVSVVEVWPADFNIERWLRAYGSLPHPNILGVFLVVGILLALGLELKLGRQREQNILQSAFLFPSIIIMSAGLFFTFSRSAWLALVVGLVLLTVRVVRRPRREIDLFPDKGSLQKWQYIKLLSASLTAIAILTLIYWPIVHTRLTVNSRLERLSQDQRLSSYSQAKDIIQDNWLSGVGAGNYTQELSRRFPDLTAYLYHPVHNVWLLIWAELGIIGLSIIIILLIFGYSFLASKMKKDHLPWRYAFIAVSASLLIISLFDHYLWSLHIGVILLGFIIGLNVKAAQAQNTP